MDNKIEIKYLLRELMHYLKYIIIGGCVCAIIFCAYDIYTTNNSAKNVSFGSYGVIKVISEDSIVLNSDGRKTMIVDSSEINKSIILSDIVMNGAISDPSVIKYNFSAGDIRQAVHLNSKDSGQLVKLFVVTNDQEKSQLLCDAIIKQCTNLKSDSEYNITKIQSATNIGAVSVSVEKKTDNPESAFETVSQIAIPSISVRSLIKKIVAGFIFGLIIMIIIISYRYVAKDLVIFPGQLRKKGYRYAGSTVNEIMGNVLSMNEDSKSIGLLCPCGGNDFAESLSEFLCSNGKNVLVQSLDTCSLDIENIEQELVEKKEEFDYLIFNCGDVRNNPYARVLCNHLDSVVVAIPPRKISLEELELVTSDFKENSTNVVGISFI